MIANLGLCCRSVDPAPAAPAQDDVLGGVMRARNHVVAEVKHALPFRTQRRGRMGMTVSVGIVPISRLQANGEMQFDVTL